MSPEPKPRFWILIPIAVFVVFFTLLNTKIAWWNTTGTFHFAGNNGESRDLGYVRDATDPAITYTTTINGKDGYKEYTYFADGIPAEFQQVKILRLYVGTLLVGNGGSYYQVVQIIGPVAKNYFRFSPIEDGEVTIIYNFDSLTIPANEGFIEVTVDGRVQTFTDGYWGYATYSPSPIVANDGVAGYLTKGGFGRVCNVIGEACPNTITELYADRADHWVYYHIYLHEIVVTP